MQRPIGYFSGITIFLAGVVAGILTTRSTPEQTADKAGRDTGATPAGSQPAGSAGAIPETAASPDLKRAVINLESRLVAQETAAAARFAQIEARLDENSAKLAEVPSTAQIVSAMEQLLSKTMVSLDDRLTTQAHSIEVLKTTVSQTDSLLERVLESLDSLQTDSESSNTTEDGLFSRAV